MLPCLPGGHSVLRSESAWWTQIPVPIQWKLRISLQCPVNEFVHEWSQTWTLTRVTVVPRMLLSQLGSSEESHPGLMIWTMLTSVVMMKDGRMQMSTLFAMRCNVKRLQLSRFLILTAMQCNMKRLVLILFTFFNVRTPLSHRVLILGVTALETQSNSSLNSNRNIYSRN